MNNNEIVPGFDVDEDKTLKISLQRIDEHCLVFYLNGQMDTYSSSHAEKKFGKAIENGYVRIIVDARGLCYASSMGVGIFVNLFRTLSLRNGSIVFMHVQPIVWQIFELLGFAKWFTVVEDLDEAVRSFSGSVKEWPFTFKCPICNKRLKASKPGRFRCGECRSILEISPEMQVSLG
jgi:anti-sigma B factor antagonist